MAERVERDKLDKAINDEFPDGLILGDIEDLVSEVSTWMEEGYLDGVEGVEYRAELVLDTVLQHLKEDNLVNMINDYQGPDDYFYLECYRRVARMAIREFGGS